MDLFGFLSLWFSNCGKAKRMGFIRLKGVGLSVYRTARIFKASRKLRSGLVWGLGLGVHKGSEPDNRRVRRRSKQ